MENTHSTTTTTTETPFTTEELTDIARDAFGAPHGVTVDRGGYRYTFSIQDDDVTGMDYLNDMDGLGRVQWGTTDRYTGYDVRPAGFDGAARKLHIGRSHDTMWWQPYRDETGIYDDDRTRQLVTDILEYGIIGCVVDVETVESCGHHHNAGHAALWGIESPLCLDGNYAYLADVFADLVTEATPETTTETTTTTTTTTTGTPTTVVDYGDAWVCTDCLFTHHYGATEHDGQWYAGDSDTPCDRVPLALLDGYDISDNTCSNHDVEELYDADGYPAGETTQCEHCGQRGHETGIEEFSWRSCAGCGSTLGGSRYRLHVTRREAVVVGAAATQ